MTYIGGLLQEARGDPHPLQNARNASVPASPWTSQLLDLLKVSLTQRVGWEVAPMGRAPSWVSQGVWQDEPWCP